MPRSLPNIEIRSKLLRNGRASISPRTDSRKVRKARQVMLHKLIDAGRADIVERIRSRELRIEAVEAAYDANDLARLARVAGDAMTLDVAIARLLARAKANGRGSTGTLKIKQVIGRAMLHHFGAKRELADITTDEIEKFLYDPKVKGKRGPGGNVWSASRQESARLMGSQLWAIGITTEREVAQKAGGVPRLTVDPWKAIKIDGARGGHERVAFLTREQWLRLEVENRDVPELALCALGCLAGLREGEATHLRTGVDLDMDARLIRVQPRKGEHAWKPKTPRSVRVVPISDRLHAILARHIELGFAGVYVIRSPRSDGPLGKTGIVNWTRKAFERAGITYGQKVDGFTNHTLRHTFASWLAQADVQLKKIAELMGDTVETVARYYAHLLKGDLDMAVKIIDKQLAGAA